MIATVMMPPLLQIGGGASLEAGRVLARLGVSAPLVVTDPHLDESGLVRRITEVLDGEGVRWGLYAGVVADPTTECVAECLKAVRAGGHDALLAVGGGSSIDTAKAVSILAAHGGRMRDWKVPVQVDRPGLPVIAIPTTAGTGSEVTRFTVITDTDSNEKMLIAGAGLVPSAALVDFELTMTMPWRLTADTGLDSLTHAIEAYVSRRRNPFSDVLALKAAGLIARHIRTACRHPGDREAREAMMLGATLAGIAFSNASVALVHGMSRPIGAFFHVPHGLSNAMLLPAVTAFSAPAAADRYADIARAMGCVPAEADDQAAVAALLGELRALNADLKVPKPSEYGIDANRYFSLLETMAGQALASGSPANNPRVPDQAEIVILYQEAWG